MLGLDFFAQVKCGSQAVAETVLVGTMTAGRSAQQL